MSKAVYLRSFADPGYYILGMACTASIYSSATGGLVGRISGVDDVGSTAPSGGGSTDAVRANGLTAMDRGQK